MKPRRRRFLIAASAVVLIPLCWAIGQPGRPHESVPGRFVHLRLHYPYEFAIGQEEDDICIGGLCISYPTSYRRAIAGVEHCWIPEIKILRGETGWSDRYFGQWWTCHGEALLSINKSSWYQELDRRKRCKEQGIEP